MSEPSAEGGTARARVRETVSNILRSPSDVRIDARSIVDLDPAIRECKSAYVDLVYEEFCRRSDGGESLDPLEFAAGFPTIRHSLVKLFRVDGLLRANPEFFRTKIDWPDVGETFLGFQLLESLGMGVLSRVFLAREAELDERLVVVKVIPAESREPRTVARLEHSSIVDVLSTTVDDERGLRAMCMPYRTRATLLDVLDVRDQHERLVIPRAVDRANRVDESLPRTTVTARDYVESIVDVMTTVADALEFAHAKGILHCDVKPSNILLKPDGRPLLVDFNLAVDSAAPRAHGGTLPYMAPEQLHRLIDSKEKIDLEARTDVFGLGATLYELLNGRLPFGDGAVGESLQAAAIRLRAEQGRTLDFSPTIDPGLTAIVASCLAVDPSDRPRSAARLAKQLRNWQSRRRRGRIVRALCAGGVIGLAVWSMTSGSTTTPRDALVAIIARANQALDAKDFTDAERRYAAALEYPIDVFEAGGWLKADIAMRRAWCLQRSGKPDLACDAFVSAQSEMDRAHRAGRFQEVVVACERALEFDDELLDRAGVSRIRLVGQQAYALIATGQYETALQLLDRVGQPDPAIVDNLGLLWYRHVVHSVDSLRPGEVRHAVTRMLNVVHANIDRGDYRLMLAELCAIQGALHDVEPREAGARNTMQGAEIQAMRMTRAALELGTVTPEALANVLRRWPRLGDSAEYAEVDPSSAVGFPVENMFVDPLSVESGPPN